MNLVQSLFVKGAQEAGELVSVFAQLAALGPKAVDQSAPSPAVSTEDDEDGGTGQPLVLKAIKEINEILAAVELLRDRGIPLAGIGDPVAVGEAKNMIVKCMEQAMQDGQLVLNDDDKNPRPEGVNEASNGIPQGDEGGEGNGDQGYDDNSDQNAAAGDEAGDTSDDSGDDAEGSGDEGGDETDDTDDSEGDDGEETDSDEEEDNTDDDTDETDDDDGSDTEEDEPGSNDV